MVTIVAYIRVVNMTQRSPAKREMVVTRLKKVIDDEAMRDGE
jgi:hypothetical protein